jgi:Family of unknown function (DUF5678)
MMATTVPALDLTAILKDIPRGAWVAISRSQQRVVAFGSEMSKVVEEAKNNGELHPLVVRVPESATSLML